jgi:hypothetical protein
MDTSIITALAALTGTFVGGMTNVVANLLSQRMQVRAQWLTHEKNRRQILYRDFIEEAAKCYVDALQHDEADIPSLVGLYAKLSRMRVLSSEPVVNSADHIARKILDIYLRSSRNRVGRFERLKGHRARYFGDILHFCRVQNLAPFMDGKTIETPSAALGYVFI